MVHVIQSPVIDGENYRLRLKRRFLRKPLIILEKRVERHHSSTDGRNFDDWTTSHWVPADVKTTVLKSVY